MTLRRPLAWGYLRVGCDGHCVVVDGERAASATPARVGPRPGASVGAASQPASFHERHVWPAIAVVRVGRDEPRTRGETTARWRLYFKKNAPRRFDV